MPPAGRNSPLHKFSDLCKGGISLSVAEGSKLPDGKHVFTFNLLALLLRYTCAVYL